MVKSLLIVAEKMSKSKRGMSWRGNANGCAPLAHYLRRRGLSYSEIQAELGISRSSAWRIVKGQPKSAKKGRKPTVAAKKLAARRTAIKKAVDSLPRRGGRVASNVLRSICDKWDVSLSTVKRDLKTMADARKMRRGPWREPGDEAARLRMAKALLKEGACKSIVFSDEKYFDLQYHGTMWQWVLRDCGDEVEIIPSSEQGAKIHVWCGIGPNGWKRMVILPSCEECAKRPRHLRHVFRAPKKNKNERRGRKRLPIKKLKRFQKKRKGVDAEIYIDDVLTKLIPTFRRNPNWQLMQDGAGPHKAHDTQEWLKKNKIKLVQWVARSCDLNPVENVWSALAYRASRVQSANVDVLTRELQRTFQAMDTRGVYDSFERRLLEVVRLNGRTIAGEWRLKPSKKSYEVLVRRRVRAAAAKRKSSKKRAHK